MRLYGCIKCKDLVVTYHDGASPLYHKRAIPVGKGSALYMEWLCADCDPVAIEKYAKVNEIGHRLGNTPWIGLIRENSERKEI